MQSQLHVVANSSVASGGEGLAALRYAESIARAGIEVTLISKKVSEKKESSSYGKGSFDKQIAPTRRNLMIELFDQYRFMQKICEGRQINLIHLHGMWSPILAVAALISKKKKITLVISPHGCLEPWSLKYKHHKKWLALKTYQGAILRWTSLFVATAHQELKSIRQLGLHQPVAVIPNGVDIGPAPHRDVHVKVKTILFLSRLNPVKGLIDLVEAWALVRRPGWRIVIAGGDEDGYRAKVEALIRKKGLQSDFEFADFVEGACKQACFESAEIFILPTYSENFGIVVAEALANEVPVITTTKAPWKGLVEHRCGWWVEPGVQGILGALINALDCDSEELREMGRRGRQLVNDKFSWDKIGATALEVSEWLLYTPRPTPEAVSKYKQ